MGRRMRAVQAFAAGAACALLLSACGGEEDDVATTTMPTAAAIVDPADAAADPALQVREGGEESAGRSNTALPDLQVVRVASNETVALQQLAPAGKPVVLWFWAPHCTFCRAEAPELLAFEKTHGQQVTVLGLGAQDDLDQAVDFLADTSTGDLEMVWDRTGKSWLHFKVTNQPTVVVVDADGKVTKKWFRDFDEKAILAAAGLT